MLKKQCSVPCVLLLFKYCNVVHCSLCSYDCSRSLHEDPSVIHLYWLEDYSRSRRAHLFWRNISTSLILYSLIKLLVRICTRRCSYFVLEKRRHCGFMDMDPPPVLRCLKSTQFYWWRSHKSPMASHPCRPHITDTCPYSQLGTHRPVPMLLEHIRAADVFGQHIHGNGYVPLWWFKIFGKLGCKECVQHVRLSLFRSRGSDNNGYVLDSFQSIISTWFPARIFSGPGRHYPQGSEE